MSITLCGHVVGSTTPAYPEPPGTDQKDTATVSEGTDKRAGSGRATMVDVAKAAGVSLKTVSRVINREPGVNPDTSARVLDSAAALRYERNDLAASLRHGGRSSTLGLII
jgi:Bacterial regulatory proteins, lacI family